MGKVKKLSFLKQEAIPLDQTFNTNVNVRCIMSSFQFQVVEIDCIV